MSHIHCKHNHINEPQTTVIAQNSAFKFIITSQSNRKTHQSMYICIQ